MVLGLRSKNRKGVSVQVEYTVHVQEIKPWPPSQSLRSLRSVVLQWENGDQNSGLGSPVAPSIEEGRIVFGESFNLQVSLQKEASGKGNDGGAFLKNILELNLYEMRREKAGRGQLLGGAAVDLAEHGVIQEPVSLSVPVNCKRSFRNTAQPVLSLRIQPFKKAEAGSGSSTSESPVKEESADGGHAVDSAPPLIHGEIAEGEEIASFTDDDISSSKSSLPRADPASQSESASSPPEDAREEPPPYAGDSESTMTPSKSDVTAVLCPPETTAVASDGVHEEEALQIKVEDADSMAEKRETPNEAECSEDAGDLRQISDEAGDRIENGETIGDGMVENSSEREDVVILQDSNGMTSHGEGEIEEITVEKEAREEDEATQNDAVEIRCLADDSSKAGEQAGTPRNPAEEEEGSSSDLLPQSAGNCDPRLLKSVRSSTFAARNDHPAEDVKEIDVLEQARHGSKKFRNRESSLSIRRKVSELESRVILLEAELREAAAAEIALYSVVAEHGSSPQKIHAPARRLLRLYGSGGGARTAVSGFALAAKACGNDVPRLTFWLSNAAVLRAAVAQRVDLPDSPRSTGSPLRWEPSIKSEKHLSSTADLEDWADPRSFISALEKIEAWIFSRVVESLWWQTLTPLMQCPGHIDTQRGEGQQQASFSIELWKKAFKDACERLCPVRAGGHQCGCLPMLPKLIMEQCVARLDVAMFNALLRDSGDDIPTDPVSDPITDPWVLPIPAGKSSFSAGAQLKNAVGTWSRGLTDWFGIDDGEEEGDDDHRQSERKTPFRLLNALSDLLMLPKDMLFDESIRREVCPCFAAPVLRRILSGFEPDEFCPDAIPDELLDALDSEELPEAGEETVGSFPWPAAAVIYSPPPVAALADVIGDSCGRGGLWRSGSAVLRKSNTSDDELDELDAPLNLISADRSCPSTPKAPPHGGAGFIRYQLLREVWRGDN